MPDCLLSQVLQSRWPTVAFVVADGNTAFLMPLDWTFVFFVVFTDLQCILDVPWLVMFHRAIPSVHFSPNLRTATKCIWSVLLDVARRFPTGLAKTCADLFHSAGRSHLKRVVFSESEFV